MGNERANVGIPHRWDVVCRVREAGREGPLEDGRCFGDQRQLRYGQGYVEYDPSAVNLGELVGVVEDTGYGAEVREASLVVLGMACASCVARVERALNKVPGVLDASAKRAPTLPPGRWASDIYRAWQRCGTSNAL